MERFADYETFPSLALPGSSTRARRHGRVADHMKLQAACFPTVEVADREDDVATERGWSRPSRPQNCLAGLNTQHNASIVSTTAE